MRTWLVAAMIVGFLLTAGGLVLAYRGALTSLGASERKVARTQKLAALQRAEASLPPGVTPADVSLNEKYEVLHKAEGLRRATNGNLSVLPALHAQDVLRDAVVGARTNLIWAGVGLVISTAASVAALYT